MKGIEPEQVAAIREFNRFYTARIGLLRRRHLDGEFSLTEARVLYEISAMPGTTALALRGVLGLDAGYLSRVLASLTRSRLVRQTTSKQDGRERLLTLTVSGERAVARMDEQSAAEMRAMLATLGASERKELVAALARAREILSRKQEPEVRIVRLMRTTKEAAQILEEYYEAVHVVQRDRPGALQKMIDEPASGMWLAYLGDEVMGCVVLRRLGSVKRASECKRLYVKPVARGRGIADKLLNAQEEYARSQGVEWIYLDSYDDLKAAIALYERRGYERCERYNTNPQATLFMRKRIVA
jgi:DNA-binding MarR family transcriptional regulator/N-acetylglutamate synthase-like GNAT family acetyltransferase